MGQLQEVQLSLHCWQADDVTGFESAGELTGGIQATGNYPGKARNIDELRADVLKAASLIPGKHRLNLHEIYGDFGGKFVDRDQVEPEHFESWMQWAAENGMKLDFNSTSFSHPKSGDLSLANPDGGIRNFWIEHTKRCRADSLKSAALSEEEKKKAVKDFNFTKGILVALLAGFMSACFSIGLGFGESLCFPESDELYKTLPATLMVTVGGFLTNAVYCFYQNGKNKTWGDYSKTALYGNNLLFCALAGILWYSQFFGLSLGKGFLTSSPALLTFSWCILMSLNVTFSNVWGIILKEWKGCSSKTITVLVIGLLVLIVSSFLPELLK